MSAFLQIWGFPKRGHTQIIDSSTMLVLKSGDPSCWEPPYADLHGIRETAVRTLPPPGHKVGFLEAKRGGPSPPKPSSIKAGNQDVLETLEMAQKHMTEQSEKKTQRLFDNGFNGPAGNQGFTMLYRKHLPLVSPGNAFWIECQTFIYVLTRPRAFLFRMSQV